MDLRWGIINQLIKLNLIDRYCIAVIPTILGKGKSLFSNVLESKKLKLISTNTYNGIVDLVYERK